LLPSLQLVDHKSDTLTTTLSSHLGMCLVFIDVFAVGSVQQLYTVRVAQFHLSQTRRCCPSAV